MTEFPNLGNHDNGEYPPEINSGPKYSKNIIH